MAPHWKHQSGYPTPAVGKTFFLPSAKEGLRISDHAPAFRGYELVAGVPRFEFTVGDTPVRLLIDALSSDQLRLTYSIGKRAEPVYVVGPPAKGAVSMSASAGTWTENRLTITETGDIVLTLTVKRGK